MLESMRPIFSQLWLYLGVACSAPHEPGISPHFLHQTSVEAAAPILSFPISYACLLPLMFESHKMKRRKRKKKRKKMKRSQLYIVVNEDHNLVHHKETWRRWQWVHRHKPKKMMEKKGQHTTEDEETQNSSLGNDERLRTSIKRINKSK